MKRAQRRSVCNGGCVGWRKEVMGSGWDHWRRSVLNSRALIKSASQLDARQASHKGTVVESVRLDVCVCV